MKKKFAIYDWAGNRLFKDELFDTFEDGWTFIYMNVSEEYEGDGAYDDLYVEPLKD